MRGIVLVHLLFEFPGRARCAGQNQMPVVVRGVRILHPQVIGANKVIGQAGAEFRCGHGAVSIPQAEQAGGGAPIAFGFDRAGKARGVFPEAPGGAVFPRRAGQGAST
ncbi:MAG: hypothetical protein HC901_04465, partial [Bdellovibrionaceae bacterium]|nr:hypothetical protein [Pseudobdellovibrionaceae bacterium]